MKRQLFPVVRWYSRFSIGCMVLVALMSVFVLVCTVANQPSRKPYDDLPIGDFKQPHMYEAPRGSR